MQIARRTAVWLLLAVFAVVIVGVVGVVGFRPGHGEIRETDPSAAAADHCGYTEEELKYDGWSSPEENGSIYEILYYIVLDSSPALDEVRVFSREGVVERVECPPVR